MAGFFNVLLLALPMETVGSRNQQVSRDQKPAKDTILDDHTYESEVHPLGSYR